MRLLIIADTPIVYPVIQQMHLPITTLVSAQAAIHQAEDGMIHPLTTVD